MYLVVLLLGILVVAAGGVTALFGFSIKEFSVGSTMLISGTTAIVGGLVLIALAAAIRELRRIAEAVSRRQPHRFPRVPQPSPGVHPGIGAPPIPPPTRDHDAIPPSRDANPNDSGPEAEQAEPKSGSLQPTAVVEAMKAQRLPGLRLSEQVAVEPAAVSSAEPAADTSSAFEPPQVAEPDAIPLSPEEESQPPRDRIAETEAADDHGPSAEHDAGPESIDLAAADDTEAVAQESPPHDEPTRRDESALRFDDIWPEDEPPFHPSSDEAAPDSPSAEDLSAGEEKVDHGAGTASEEAAAVDAAPEPENDIGLAPEPEPLRPISILKSGVIDGMAYALYSDGSIEAELSSGTIRFASIEELRAHLEKTE